MNLIEDDEHLIATCEDSAYNPPPNVIEFAERFVVMPKSAISAYFLIGATPWLKEPMERAVHDINVRVVTLRKPVQTGGSAMGEILILYWCRYGRGIVQYNWSKNERASDRWRSRVKDLFEGCPALSGQMTRGSVSECQIDFGSTFFQMQGAFVSSNLDSDTVPYQVNEEVHDWEPGHLAKARGRSTAVWNYKSVDISNADVVGGQMDKAFCAGTQQHWMVKCPGCGGWHSMRTRWENDKPHLGGLRYDAEKARRGKFDYDYNAIRPTIEFWMPCGFRVHNEDVNSRKQMSVLGKYSEPHNRNAERRFLSYTYQAVSVDFIDWMDLIRAKHEALRDRAYGNPEPWRIYMAEKECIPYDPEDVPIINVVSTSVGIKKSRSGLPQPRLRSFALDRQQGVRDKGELPYWWLTIVDYKIFFGRLRCLLVFEGKVETDEQAIAILDEHGCERHMGVADSGDDADHVYSFCMRYGINAIKGGGHEWYNHDGGARRSYSPEKPLHSMLNMGSKFDYVDEPQEDGTTRKVPDDREPLFWLYSKGAIRERHFWLTHAENVDYVIPEDVSEDFKNHCDAEVREIKQLPGSGEDVVRWRQVKRRNDLWVCMLYCDMVLDMSGALGEFRGSDISGREIETENETK